MIKVTYGTNLDRASDIVSEDITLKKFLEDHGVDYSRGVMHLDGASLPAGSLDKTFRDLNVATKCYLLSVVKTDNAA